MTAVKEVCTSNGWLKASTSAEHVYTTVEWLVYVAVYSVCMRVTLNKWSRDLYIYMAGRNVVQECWAGFRRELDAMGVLPPCKKLNPIEPPLRIDEYHMMQRDKTKCESCSACWPLA